MGFRGAAEFLLVREAAEGKSKPGEGKSKPFGRKIQALGKENPSSFLGDYNLYKAR
jgi:hypothetical protein